MGEAAQGHVDEQRDEHDDGAEGEGAGRGRRVLGRDLAEGDGGRDLQEVVATWKPEKKRVINSPYELFIRTKRR